MKKKRMQNISKSGVIELELNEIKKIQKSADSILSLWSNTCADFYTVICC